LARRWRRGTAINRRRIDDVALDAVGVEQAMNPKTIEPDFVDRHNLDRRCNALLGFGFLELLDQVTAENQPVSSNSRAGNYAPKLFAKRPDRDGFVKANFEASMHELFADHEIVNIDYAGNTMSANGS